jgi:hypothetical protein
MTITQKAIVGLAIGSIFTIRTVFLPTVDASKEKIKLDAFHAYANQHQKDNFSFLIDSNIKTKYTVWNPKIKPYVITFPLYNYSKCIIQQLRYSINNGNPSKQKYYYIRRDNGQKVLFHSYSGGVWTPDNPVRIFNVPPNLQGDASAFIIENEGGDDFPEDIELYGECKTKTVLFPTIQRSPLSHLMGVVVKPWDISNNMFPEKQPAIQQMGINRIRLYADHQLLYNTATGGLDVNLGLWRMMDNVKQLKSKGVDVQLCYLGVPYWPFPEGKARTNPETYLQLAKDIYFLSKVNKANGDPISVIEVLNEANAWYGRTLAEYMDGYAIAAMMSICYDGHKGKYSDVGIKASGTSALMSTPGLAEAEPYIFYQMAEWSIKNRGYKPDGTIDFPFDVYSFHLYSSLEGQRQGIPGGTPPEIGMFSYMRKINEVRKILNKKLLVHIGEWGWDIHPQSMLNAPAFGKYSANQTCAMWSVRALLGMAENEINASSYYRISQDYNKDDNNATIFSTMALLRVHNESGNKQPDGSYTGFDIRRTLTGDYLKQLSEFYNKGYVFDSRISDSPNVLRFKKGTSELYVIWESEKMTITNRPEFTERTGTFMLNKKGKLLRFADDSSGVMSTENFSGGKVTYGSKPILIATN